MMLNCLAFHDCIICRRRCDWSSASWFHIFLPLVFGIVRVELVDLWNLKFLAFHHSPIAVGPFVQQGNPHIGWSKCCLFANGMTNGCTMAKSHDPSFFFISFLNFTSYCFFLYFVNQLLFSYVSKGYLSWSVGLVESNLP